MQITFLLEGREQEQEELLHRMVYDCGVNFTYIYIHIPYPAVL